MRFLSDTIPGALSRIQVGRFHFRVSQPRGRERSARDNFSIAVPFQYAVASQTKQRAVVIVCHLFHPELASWLLDALQQSGLSADLYISTNSVEKADSIKSILSKWAGGAIEICIVKN